MNLIINMGGTNQSTRIEFIDLAKGVCILLVVMLHVMPSLDEKIGFLSCFRLPLYFCLSGLFYKDYGGFLNLMLKKFNKILVPFIAWYFIGYAIYYLGRLIMPSGNEATFHFNDLLVKNEIFNLPIWFLLCLFWCNILFAFVRKVSTNWLKNIGLVVLIAICGYIMNCEEVFNFLYIGSAMTSMPFFYFGYALKKTTILYPMSNKKYDLLIMVIAFAVGLAIVFIPDCPPHFEFYTNKIVEGNVFLIYIVGFILVLGVLLMCKFIKYLPFISWLGRYSIIVLVTHMWLRDINSSALAKLMNTDKQSMHLEVINLFMVIALMVIVIPFCKKYLAHITAQKDLIPFK